MEKEIIHFEQTDLPIKIHRLSMCQGGSYRGMHAHVAAEVVTVKSGELRCWVNQEVILLRPNETLFINGNTGHRLVSDSAEIVYMHIDINRFTDFSQDNAFSKLFAFVSHAQARSHLLVSENRETEEILHGIERRYYEDQPGSRWYLKAYIYQLIGFLCAREFIVPPVISGKRMEKIEKIVRYIDDNFRSPITLDEICDAVGYNKYAVCHYFKAATGATVFDYINFLRVHFAIEELKRKGSSVLEVAAASGFSSPTYFNRVFKSVVGCAPSVYRKNFAESRK